MAVQFGKYATEGALKSHYERLRKYGEGLPRYDSTGLHKEWQAHSTQL